MSDVLSLHLIDEDLIGEWRVWPEPQSVPPGLIHETGRYVLELRGASDADRSDLLVDDVKLEALRAPLSGSARWRWSPGFHAGIAEVELRVPGHSPKFIEITTDPDRRKLTRDDFDSMVREILNDTFALFSLTGFRRSVARGSGGRAPAIARLEFLRSRISELEVIVADIQRHPRHRLVAEERGRPWHQAARATGPEILRSFRTGRIIRDKSAQQGLPPALKGYLPDRIRVRERLTSADIPEHRQMAACLHFWSGWLNSAADALERASSEADSDRRRSVWLGRSRKLARRIANLQAMPLFENVGPASPCLMLSPIFRQDPAYRRFYRIWQDMNLGIAAVFGAFLSLPLSRTFDLYELWCFLRLVRAAVEEFGAEGLDLGNLFARDSAGRLTVAADAATVSFGNGWVLSFKRQYGEFWWEGNGRGSFSREMVPDISLHRRQADGTEQLVVLDAKYRIDDGLSGALSSIHTYRDALVSDTEGELRSIVSGAYLIAPHAPLLRSDYRDTPLPERLFHSSYRKSFHFGAISMRPGMSLPAVRSELATVIADLDRRAG